MKRRLLLSLSSGLFILMYAMTALGQDYPSKPIRIISPYAAGGGNDMMARFVAERLSVALAQTVIVDNRPGANSMIGNEFVAKSPPDGYTLIMNGNGFVTGPSFYAKIPYDTAKDLIPVSFLGFTQLALVVHPPVPAADVKELISLAKAKPTYLNFGNAGHGGPDYLAQVLFNHLARVNIPLIPYKGSAPAINDLLGGQVQMMITPLAAVQPHIETGKLRLLAMGDKTRSPKYPNVPTLAEAGVRDYEAFIWYGLMAPAGTPEPVVRRLSDEISKMLRQKDVIAKLAASGIAPGDEAVYGTPEKFRAFVRSELEKIPQITRAAGIQPE